MSIIENFENWLKNCPVKIVGRSDVISGKNAEDGLVTIEFYKKRSANKKANKKEAWTLNEILNAFEKSYGEDMMIEYPGFIKRLTKSTKNIDLSHKDFIE